MLKLSAGSTPARMTIRSGIRQEIPARTGTGTTALSTAVDLTS
ncbi:MAG TPA: hypothetical protein VH396_20120 [Chitinophagaceae bacterium]